MLLNKQVHINCQKVCRSIPNASLRVEQPDASHLSSQLVLAASSLMTYV